MIDSIKKNWGESLFLLIVAVTVLVVGYKGPVTHYKLFTDPAPLLWNHQNPYYINGVRTGFFYSPSAAMFFFGFFRLFGYLGVLFYAALNVAVLIFGLRELFSVLKEKIGFDIDASPYRHIFWLMVTSETIGGLVAIKIDVLIMGIGLWTLSALLKQKNIYLSSFCFGLVTCWKLHPIFVFGLLSVGLVALEPFLAIRYASSYFAGLVFSFSAPCLFLNNDFVFQVTRDWFGSIQEYIRGAWLDRIFQHFYGFLYRGLHVPMDFDFANRLTMIIGAFFAGYVWWKAHLFRRTAPNLPRATLIPLVAVGIGSAYVVLFSQLIQSNSYVIYLPVVIGVIVIASLLNWNKNIMFALLIGCYVIISLVYSDLCPRFLYRILYDVGVKPVGVLILLITLLIGVQQLTKSHRLVLPSEERP